MAIKHKKDGAYLNALNKVNGAYTKAYKTAVKFGMNTTELRGRRFSVSPTGEAIDAENTGKNTDEG